MDGDRLTKNKMTNNNICHLIFDCRLYIIKSAKKGDVNHDATGIPTFSS